MNTKCTLCTVSFYVVTIAYQIHFLKILYENMSILGPFKYHATPVGWRLVDVKIREGSKMRQCLLNFPFPVNLLSQKKAR